MRARRGRPSVSPDGAKCLQIINTTFAAGIKNPQNMRRQDVTSVSGEKDTPEPRGLEPGGAVVRVRNLSRGSGEAPF